MGDRLYRCCLKLMNFNPTDAEDALSRAMLHAWEKVQNYVGTIRNLKGWLMRVTYNFCIDVLRKESRRAVGVEDIEWVGDTGDMGLGSKVESPEMVLEREEKSIEIRRAVDSLPEKMRDTFILHFYEELSHNEIVERQGVSYDCVCKRISQARKKLKLILRGYFIPSEVEGGNMSQSLPKMEERDLPKNREPIVGLVQCNTNPTVGMSFKNCKSQRPLRGSPEVLIGTERETVRGETEDGFVDAVVKPEMVEGPVESRERVEVMIPEAVTVSAEADGAECLESVEVVGEEIVAGVCGEHELRPILPGVLSLSTLDLTWRSKVMGYAPLSEWGREMLGAFLRGKWAISRGGGGSARKVNKRTKKRSQKLTDMNVYMRKENPMWRHEMKVIKWALTILFVVMSTWNVGCGMASAFCDRSMNVIAQVKFMDNGVQEECKVTPNSVVYGKKKEYPLNVLYGVKEQVKELKEAVLEIQDEPDPAEISIDALYGYGLTTEPEKGKVLIGANMNEDCYVILNDKNVFEIADYGIVTEVLTKKK